MKRAMVGNAPHRSSIPLRRAAALVAAIGLFTALAGVATGCDGRAGASGSLFPRTGADSFLARRAAIAIWYDKRPSGSIIKHGLLVLDSPARPSGSQSGRGQYFVTAAPEICRKIEEILGDKLPVQRGSPMSFAIGSPVPVRIERVGAHGSRELVEEGRVAFLEVVRN